MQILVAFNADEPKDYYYNSKMKLSIILLSYITCPDTLKIKHFMKETANSLDQKKNSLYEPCTSSTSSEIAYLGKIIRKLVLYALIH